MNDLDLISLNKKFSSLSVEQVVKELLENYDNDAIVSTNFAPYEAVILDICTKILPNIKILWVDSGYMLPETYRFAEKLIKELNLNIQIYTPLVTKARREALYGSIPNLDNEKALQNFADEVKLEPFKRALNDLNPKLWITSLRREQNQFRQKLDFASFENNLLKINPILEWKEKDLKNYLAKYSLANELIYFDPSKAGEHRECGLHNRLNL